jgi:hypothetical protein
LAPDSRNQPASGAVARVFDPRHIHKINELSESDWLAAEPVARLLLARGRTGGQRYSFIDVAG